MSSYNIWPMDQIISGTKFFYWAFTCLSFISSIFGFAVPSQTNDQDISYSYVFKVYFHIGVCYCKGSGSCPKIHSLTLRF